jgi:hypothetical protein
MTSVHVWLRRFIGYVLVRDGGEASGINPNLALWNNPIDPLDAQCD